jgi:nucleotide-binding universal stress UspA family protein
MVMPILKRVLVPVDFSACSRAALDHAYLLAEQFGGTLDVVNVWRPPRYIGPDEAFGEPRKTLWEYARADASKEMEQFLAEFQKRGRVRINSRLEQGNPYETILNIANAGNFDIIVMGTHGRTGLPHILLGSVAERVVRHSRCPVLTVRAGEPTMVGGPV